MYISLRYLRQRPAEQLRDYIRHFHGVHARTRDIPEAAVVAAFFWNIQSVGMHDKMAAQWVHTIIDLYHVTYACAPLLEAGIVPGSGGVRLPVPILLGEPMYPHTLRPAGAALSASAAASGGLGPRPSPSTDLIELGPHCEPMCSFILEVTVSRNASRNISVKADFTTT